MESDAANAVSGGPNAAQLTSPLDTVHPPAGDCQSNPGMTGRQILERYSFEVTCRGMSQVRESIRAIPPGTRVNITALGRETYEDRVAAASDLIDLGLQPVAHIAARRVSSVSRFSDFMSRLTDLGASEDVFVIGGDARDSEGPFGDAFSLIDSGILADFGVRRVGVAVYPEGHPFIDDGVLASDLASKLGALRDQRLEAYAISQLCFDAQAVSSFVGPIIASGTLADLRIGLPGPTTAKKLIAYATQFGVKSSIGIVRKYGLSLANLMSTAKPGRFIEDLTQTIRPNPATPTLLHFYPFGAVKNTIDWIGETRMQRG